MKKAVYRIADANLNRSREGLRVCEDIARFVLDSKALAARLKSVRHAISQTVMGSEEALHYLSASRDSVGDVLRGSALGSEMRRGSFADLFAANIERVKESLRVLEELYKLIDVKDSAKFCRLRYKVYALEKDALKRLNDTVRGRKVR